MEHVGLGNAVAMCARRNLHCDNLPCQQRLDNVAGHPSLTDVFADHLRSLLAADTD